MLERHSTKLFLPLSASPFIFMRMCRSPARLAIASSTNALSPVISHEPVPPGAVKLTGVGVAVSTSVDVFPAPAVPHALPLL